MSPEKPSDRVNASPVRSFFVSMLVRDIELRPAIVDLVDNSVDGAKRELERRGVEPTTEFAPDSDGEEVRDLAGFSISLRIDGTHLAITDNCGGIPIDVARDYAFRFGRPDSDIKGPLGEVGQFGVGMKRALFKLGNRIHITSRSKSSHFELPIDVQKWLTETGDDWNFRMTEVGEGEDNNNARLGTTVTVEDLHPDIASELSQEAFIDELTTELRTRLTLPLRRGLDISVNDIAIKGEELGLISSTAFQPIHVAKSLTSPRGNVEMSLYAGLVNLDANPAAIEQEGEGEAWMGGGDAGWYLYCNDRLLLVADTSGRTGWGTEAARYHPQYRQFRGYVFLEGDAAAMPWTTTKTAVDDDHPIFRQAQTAMFDALKKTQKVMNRLKKEVQSNPPNKRPAVSAASSAPTVKLSLLKRRDDHKIPKKVVLPSTETWIRFRVSNSEFEEVADLLGVAGLPPGDVGLAVWNQAMTTLDIGS